MYPNLSLNNLRRFIFLGIALIIVIIGFNIVGMESLLSPSSSPAEDSSDVVSPHLYFLQNILVSALYPVDFNLYEAKANWKRATWKSEELEQGSLFYDYYENENREMDFVRVTILIPALLDFTESSAKELSEQVFNRTSQFTCETREEQTFCTDSWKGSKDELYTILIINGVLRDDVKETRIMYCVRPVGSSVYEDNTNCRPLII
jgi:hypothetical protein